jgi:hypothetical protein
MPSKLFSAGLFLTRVCMVFSQSCVRGTDIFQHLSQPQSPESFSFRMRLAKITCGDVLDRAVTNVTCGEGGTAIARSVVGNKSFVSRVRGIHDPVSAL